MSLLEEFTGMSTRSSLVLGVNVLLILVARPSMPPRTRSRTRDLQWQEAEQYNLRSLLLRLPNAVLATIAEHLHPAAVVRLSAVSRLMSELPCSTWRERVLFSVDSYYADSDSDSWETEPSDDDGPRRAYHDWRGPRDGTAWPRHPFDDLNDPRDYNDCNELPADTVLRVARSDRLRLVGGLWVEVTQAELPAVIAAVGTNKHHVERLRLSQALSKEEEMRRYHRSEGLGHAYWGDSDDADSESDESPDHQALVDLAPLRGLPHLQSLSIRLHDHASTLEASLSLRGLPTTLQEIDLTSLSLTSCSDLASLPQLRVLNLDCCVHLRTLEGLQHCPQLERLELQSCVGLVAVPPLSGSIHVRLRALQLGGTHIGDLAPLAGCPLMHLNIDRCSAALMETVHHFQTLKRLHGMSVDSRTDLEPLRALRSLERLDVRLSETLADLGALADCTALRHLCVMGCRAVSHVDALAGCVRLTSLDLSYLTRLRSVDAIGALPLLAKLKFMKATQLDLSPLGGCPSLRRLDLTHAVSLKGWAELGRSLSLQMLDLQSYGPRISAAQLRALTRCPSLRALDLRSCKWFDAAALSAVASSAAQATPQAHLRIRHDGEGFRKRRRRRRREVD